MLMSASQTSEYFTDCYIKELINSFMAYDVGEIPSLTINLSKLGDT